MCMAKDCKVRFLSHLKYLQFFFLRAKYWIFKKKIDYRKRLTYMLCDTIICQKRVRLKNVCPLQHNSSRHFCQLHLFKVHIKTSFEQWYVYEYDMIKQRVKQLCILEHRIVQFLTNLALQVHVFDYLKDLNK